MDIVVWLYFREMNTLAKGIRHPTATCIFVQGPRRAGLYAVLHAVILSREQLLKLRRLGDDGHPDVGVPGIEANWARWAWDFEGRAWPGEASPGRGGRPRKDGDGELQEGQNYEALLNAARQGVPDLTVIVDHNKLQTDKPVSRSATRGHRGAVPTYGWKVLRCDGHHWMYRRTFEELRRPRDAGQRHRRYDQGTWRVVHGASARAGGRARPVPVARGRPDDESSRARATSCWAGCERGSSGSAWSAGGRGGGRRRGAILGAVRGSSWPRRTARRCAPGRPHPEIVVLDGDSPPTAGCAPRGAIPDRFIENGIAEQDMVSMAGASRDWTTAR